MFLREFLIVRGVKLFRGLMFSNAMCNIIDNNQGERYFLFLKSKLLDYPVRIKMAAKTLAPQTLFFRQIEHGKTALCKTR